MIDFYGNASVKKSGDLSTIVYRLSKMLIGQLSSSESSLTITINVYLEKEVI